MGEYAVIIGEALIDSISYSGGHRMRLGGGPFNLAITLGSIGVDTRFVSSISNDFSGKKLLRELGKSGVDSSFSVTSDLPTTIARVETDERGGVGFSFETDGTSIIEIIPEKRIVRSLEGASCIGIGSLGILIDGFREASRFALENADETVVVFLDPNIRPEIIESGPGEDSFRQHLDYFCRNSDVVKCSEDDLSWWFPHLSGEAAAIEILEMGVDLVVLTRGPKGASAFFDDVIINCNSKRFAEGSQVGAGDAFFGSLISCLVSVGKEKLQSSAILKKCLSKANKTAAEWISSGAIVID